MCHLFRPIVIMVMCRRLRITIGIRIRLCSLRVFVLVLGYIISRRLLFCLLLLRVILCLLMVTTICPRIRY